MTRANSNWQRLAFPLKQITIKRQGTEHSTLDDLLSRLQHIAGRVNAWYKLGYDHDDDFGYVFEAAGETGVTFFADPASVQQCFLGENKMNKRLHNTTQPFAPCLKQSHPHEMRDRRTGKGKTALLALLANMTGLSVKELVQRFKLS
jgi:hypothetical protein